MSHREANHEEILGLVADCYSDPGLFCRIIVPKWFPKPMPWVHRGILSILLKKVDWLLKFGPEEWPAGPGEWDEPQLEKIVKHFVWKSDPEDPGCEAVPIFTAQRDSEGHIVTLDLALTEKMLIIMPRGVSKTTLVNVSTLFDVAYHDETFIVYLSEAATHSSAQLDNIKREMETNSMFITLFGTKKPERNDPEHWNQNQAETTDGIAITCRGRGGQVRGLNHRGERPSKIVFDDVEDKESVKTPEQRQKALEWMKGDVEPALQQIAGGKPGRIIGLGTIIHAEALLLTLANDPEWLVIRFGAIDPDGEPLWEHYKTQAQLDRIKRSFIRTGQLHIFYMEYMSTIRFEENNAKFKAEYFRYEILIPTEFPARALAMDPAISSKKGSDFCAFAVSGMTEKGRIHVLDMYGARGLSPQHMIDKFFELKFRWDTNKNGVETVAFQKALAFLLREEMFRRGKLHGPKAYFEVAEITHGHLAKKERIEGILSPRYAAGYITHQRRFPMLEEQLLDWPIGKDDFPDALAMSIMLLDPYAAWAASDGEEDSLGKDQYEDIEIAMGGPMMGAP